MFRFPMRCLRILRTIASATLVVLLVLSCAEAPLLPLEENTYWLDGAEREEVDLSGTLHTVDGKEIALSELRGDNVLFLNLWATWCGPCRAEMPAMATLYQKLKDKGLTMVAVSDEDTQTVRDYLQENSYPFTILVDSDNVLGERFEVYAIPTTLVLDNQGRLVRRHTGADEWDSPEMIERFRQLVAEQ